jgi:hypothetical protein
MAERSIIDQLDDAVSALLAKPAVEWPVEDPVVASLVGVAEELRGLPREDFRAQLRSAFAERDTMSTPKMKVDPDSAKLSGGFRTSSFRRCVCGYRVLQASFWRRGNHETH